MDGREDQGDQIATGVAGEGKDGAQQAAEGQDRMFAGESDETQPPKDRRSLVDLLASIGALAGINGASNPPEEIEPHADPKVERMFQDLLAQQNSVSGPLADEIAEQQSAVAKAWRKRSAEAMLVESEKEHLLVKRFLVAIEERLAILQGQEINQDVLDMHKIHTQQRVDKQEIERLFAQANDQQEEIKHLGDVVSNAKSGTKAGLDATASLARAIRRQADTFAELTKVQQRSFENQLRHDRLAQRTGLCKNKASE